VTSHSRTLLQEVAQHGIPDTFDAWPEIKSRLAPRETRQRHWQLGAGVAATLTVALTSIAVLATATSPQPVNADVLLANAAAAAEGRAQRTYHATATITYSIAKGGEGPLVQREDTWFGGNGRIRQEMSDQTWTNVLVSDGARAWWSITLRGQTFFTTADGIRLSEAARLNPLAPEGTSITSLLETLRKKGCRTAELQGEQTVAGRPAYRVSVTHTLAESYSCGDSLQAASAVAPKKTPEPNAATRATANDKKVPEGDKKVPEDDKKRAEAERHMNTRVSDILWIDKETLVVLKTHSEGGPKAARTYAVTSITFDVTPPASLFQYAPPAGARVLPDVEALKQSLAALAP
jgi:outer membrane lipoprotein-sorting protein